MIRVVPTQTTGTVRVTSAGNVSSITASAPDNRGLVQSTTNEAYYYYSLAKQSSDEARQYYELMKDSQEQADWNETDLNKKSFIKNKPNALSDFEDDLGDSPIHSHEQYVTSSSLSAVALSGAYSDLTDTPVIPTVNNATLTITQGGTTKGTFTANALSDVTIALDANASATVDQTFNGVSSNAQSGVAIAGEGFIKNTATGTNSVTILGDLATSTNALNVGIGSKISANYGTAIGKDSSAGGTYSTALGYYAKAGANGTIQLGYGANGSANRLYVGFYNNGTPKNWAMLVGSTGLIPTGRLPLFGGANGTNAGTLGAVPAPTATDNTKFLKGDGTWADVPTRNIGEIVTSTIPLTDADLHLLDGALISGSGSYSAFVDYIAGLVSTYPDLFDTEANWQSAVTTYGVCGKFVYDSVNDTVRLPKITGFTEGTIDPTVLGDLVEAGLPNITGTVTSDYDSNFSGAFYNLGSFIGNSGTGSDNIAGFDASRCSAIYGNSDTVQPQSIKVLYYIVIATSTKTDIQVDIDEIATDLNGKADIDLSNVPTSKAILEESYQNGTSWYRVYSDGWCEQGGVVPTSTTSVSFLKSYVNTNYSILVQYINISSSSTTYYIYYCAPVKYTDHFTITSSSNQRQWDACGYIR